MRPSVPHRPAPTRQCVTASRTRQLSTDEFDNLAPPSLTATMCQNRRQQVRHRGIAATPGKRYVPQDDSPTRGEHPDNLRQRAPLKWCAGKEHSLNRAISERQLLGTGHDERWDASPAIRPERASPTAVYVPGGRMSPFAADVNRYSVVWHALHHTTWRHANGSGKRPEEETTCVLASREQCGARSRRRAARSAARTRPAPLPRE